MVWWRSRRRTGPRPNLQKRESRTTERRSRGSRTSRVLRVIVFGGAAMLGGWTAAQAYSAIGQGWNGWFDVREITITGVRVVDKDEVLKRLQLGKHVTLLALNPLQLEDRLRAHPWIKDASVSRMPLHRLAVHVIERRPAAVLKHEMVSLLLDDEGYVLRTLLNEVDPGLPFVTGIDPDRLRRGERISQQAARQGIQLAGLFTQSFEGRPEVNMSDPGHAVVYLKDLRFRFGQAPYEEQWDRYQAVEPIRRYGAGGTQQDIDLRYSGKVIVRERAAGVGEVVIQERG